MESDGKMKISYLITCKTEGYQLQPLFERLYEFKDGSECVIVDDYTEDIDTLSVLNNLKRDTSGFFKLYQHHLDTDYGSHKNWGNQQCSGDWIFQIDGDEMPPEILLGDNLKTIIESNPNIELYWVPRLNDFLRVTEEHAKKWGWRLTTSPSLNRLVVSWPDWQGRIYKNVPDRIMWKNRLHEVMTGHNSYAFLPAEEEFALHHIKTIEKQEETNQRYNRDFTERENRGISEKIS